MQRYFVFLRAINVGGRTIKMDQLRDIFTSSGFDDVETFIASGNVILQSVETDMLALESYIEGILEAALGYSVPAILRSTDELAEIAAYQPFSDAEFEDLGDTYYVWLLKGEPSEDVQDVVSGYQTPDDLFHVHGKEVYWLCRTKISQTEVPTTRLEREFGTPCTMRNMNTIRRLVAKYS